MNKPPKELLSKLRKEYDYKKLVFKRKVNTGYLSHNFIVSNGKKNFFLKQHRHQEKSRIEEVFAVENFFTKKNIPIILPILTIDGNNLIKHDGFYYTLYPFIRGKKYSRETITKRAVISASAYLAKIHLASDKSKPNLTNDKHNPWSTKKFWEQTKLIEKKFTKKGFKNKIVQISSEILELKKEIISANTVSRKSLKLDHHILLHGDYHHNNIFFDKTDKVGWIFDWEKASMGSRYFELIRAIDLICFGEIYNKRRWSNAKTFIKTYNKHFPIKKEVLHDELLDFYLRKVHGMWLFDQYFLQGNKRILPLIPKELHKIKFYRDNIENLTNLI